VNRVPHYQRLFQNHDGKRQWWKVSKAFNDLHLTMDSTLKSKRSAYTSPGYRSSLREYQGVVRLLLTICWIRLPEVHSFSIPTIQCFGAALDVCGLAHTALKMKDADKSYRLDVHDDQTTICKVFLRYLLQKRQGPVIILTCINRVIRLGGENI